MIEALEDIHDYRYGETGSWSRLQPNQAHMKKRVWADYLDLIALCNQILVNVKSEHCHKFEQSTAIVQNHIRQNTLLPYSTLEDVFNEVKRELNTQRGILAYTYQ